MVYLITFINNDNTLRRLLRTNKRCTEIEIGTFYKKYTKINKLIIHSINNINQSEILRYSERLPVDLYDDNIDLFEARAIEWAERYGIIDYRVEGRYMIYNQNYYNNEYFGKWISKPCTYQRKVDLETFKETSRKLDRVQKNGWNNV